MTRPRGFTLLEALIGVLLVGMILAALHSGLWVGVRAYRSGQETGRRQSMFTGAGDLLARDLASLAPDRQGPKPLLLRPLSDGGLWLRLVCQAPPVRGGTPTRIDYFYMPGLGSSGKLCRRAKATPWSWQEADQAVSEPAQYEFLASNVETVTIRCFDGENWLEVWDPERMQGLPRLVELRMRAAGERSDHEFTTVVPVHVQQTLLEGNSP